MADASSRMTEGSYQKKIVAFAIPVFISNLFQQLYNTADSLIVGNFLGSEALASVSSSGNLIFMMVGFFYGMSIGAGVVIARCYGALDDEGVRKAVHTMAAFSISAGIGLTILGYFLAPQILVWMGTPEAILPGSITYFRVYFMGSVPFIVYNACVGILQAVGDSRHPMEYLIISSCVNIVLDLLFVGGFHWGVGSAAFATVLSQLLSMILALMRLCRSPEPYCLHLKKLHFDGPSMKSIFYNGIPAGAQNSIIGFANVIVQSYINAFGELAVAGQGAYGKVEGFAFLPITSFAMALTTFVSQNLGAGKAKRARDGALFGLVSSMVLAELIGVVYYFTAPYVLSLFDRDPEVIAYGVQRAHICAFFYFLLAASHCMAGILRGAGKSIVPMVVMLVCWCLIRDTMIALAMPYFRSIDVVNWIYPITWGLSSLWFCVYFVNGKWIQSSLKKA